METVVDTARTDDDEKIIEENESSDQEDLLLLEESDIPFFDWEAAMSIEHHRAKEVAFMPRCSNNRKKA